MKRDGGSVTISQMNALTMMQAGQGIPQDVDFAILAPIVVNFLSVKGPKPKLDEPSVPPILPAADIADKAKQFTV